MVEPRFPLDDFPHEPLRTYPHDFPSAHQFLAARCPSIDIICPVADCPGAELEPLYRKRGDRKYAWEVCCAHCRHPFKTVPTLYKEVTFSF